MPYAIEITPFYTKRLVKFLKKHPDIQATYQKTISLLEINPMHPSFRLHRLSGKLSDLHSVSIDMRYRITIEFYIQDKKIIPVNIGTHDDVYS